MLAKVNTFSLLGIEAFPVKVEVDISSGLPSFHIVGLPDPSVREAKERVISAIKNSQFPFPSRRITVNLAPADVKKEGSLFDLPIALGILRAQDILKEEELKNYAVLGELSLDGMVRRVNGILPIVLEAKERGIKAFILPEENAKEAAVVEGVDIYPVKSLYEVFCFLTGSVKISPFKCDVSQIFATANCYEEDFSEVKGQNYVKRALEVAAAGGHNVIMIGPPGAGKTMLARRIPSILPDLTLEEAIQTTKIHSVAGLLSSSQPLVTRRPFRSPHHTISEAGLIGGGRIPRPGEVSLSHNGVLFMDELSEFPRNVLESLRQPLEDGVVTISRALTSITYPARFMLVAAMNPCPCGYFGDPTRECSCTPYEIQKHLNKISGPLLDRIDIHIQVQAVRKEELLKDCDAESSSSIRERVNRARKIQLSRFKRAKIFCNAQMTTRHIKRFCPLQKEAEKLLSSALTELGLSARAYHRILKVARTIADLEGEEKICSHHVSEALQYRYLDRDLWRR
ncbi:YifB family Mg chelatase-like AAA ATPase [Candidatus Aerophobetes bacterium]|nr:YifB family Mg chelatase-like AAA ATPase [Candidatus Aerophobetes bacterium]